LHGILRHVDLYDSNFVEIVKRPILFAAQPFGALFPKKLERRSQKPFYDLVNVVEGVMQAPPS